MKYRRYDYDLWGNEEDGYSVNDVCATNIICEIEPEDSDESIFRRVLGRYTPLYMVEGESDSVIYISHKGIPLCELRLEEE